MSRRTFKDLGSFFPNLADFFIFGSFRFHASEHIAWINPEHSGYLEAHDTVKPAFAVAVITDIGMACLEYLRNGIVRGHIPGGLDVVQKICCCFCFHDEWVLVFTGS